MKKVKEERNKMLWVWGLIALSFNITFIVWGRNNSTSSYLVGTGFGMFYCFYLDELHKHKTRKKNKKQIKENLGQDYVKPQIINYYKDGRLDSPAIGRGTIIRLLPHASQDVPFREAKVIEFRAGEKGTPCCEVEYIDGSRHVITWFIIANMFEVIVPFKKDEETNN